MLVERSKVEHFIRERFNKFITNGSDLISMATYVTKKYNMYGDDFSDYYVGRLQLKDATEFVLYVLVDTIQFYSSSSNYIPKWFTEKEIKMFSVSKFESKPKIDFPIYFDMCQIEDDQWIGCVDSDKINELRRSELINYNSETQRTMQKVIRHGNEYFKITVNKSAVKQIQSSYDNGSYIPNTITLNIPEDPDEPAEFYYDRNEHKLVIKSIKSFDITDGYHRYLAMTQEKILNPDFNYPMELRITNFDTEKAQRFIYQEDQKTKMKKSDSNSFDTYNPANVVVTKLNTSSTSNIRQMIDRNDGNINFGKLSEVIRLLYFKNVPKKEERIMTHKVTKELIDDFNLLTDDDPSFLERKYSTSDICIIVTLFHYYSDKENKSDMLDSIKYVLEHVDDFNKKIFNNFNSRVVKQIVNKSLERS